MITLTFDPANNDVPHNTGGVYLLMDKGGDPLYIGVTYNWRARRHGHTQREYWPLVAQVVILTWDAPYEDWVANETALIQRLQPPYNRKHVTPDWGVKAAQQSWVTRKARDAADPQRLVRLQRWRDRHKRVG